MMVSVLFGISLIAFGLLTVIRPRYYSYKFGRYIDFSGFNIPIGILIGIVGIFFVWSGFANRNKVSPNEVLICPKCNEPFHSKDVPDGLCPTCRNALEKLRGYYDRHPRLRK